MEKNIFYWFLEWFVLGSESFNVNAQGVQVAVKDGAGRAIFSFSFLFR